MKLYSPYNEQLSDIDIISNKIGDISDTKFEKILKKNIILIKMSKSNRKTIEACSSIEVNGASQSKITKILDQIEDIKSKFASINEFYDLNGIESEID